MLEWENTTVPDYDKAKEASVPGLFSIIIEA